MKWWNTLKFGRVFSSMMVQPETTIATGMILSSPILNFWLKKRAKNQLITPLDDVLERGSKPCLPRTTEDNVICQEKLKASVMEFFIPAKADKESGYFGVVLGPSGIGKTTVVCSACREYPQGVIYVEITEPESFPECLAEKMGMRLGPSRMWS